MEKLHKLNRDGQVYFTDGDFQNAADCFQQAASLALRCGLLQHFAANMTNLAMAFRSMKDFDKAESVYVNILNTMPKKGLHYSRYLTNIAELHCERSEYRKAKVCYQKALQMQKSRLFTKKSPDYFHTAYRLASVYNELGDYRRAEILLDKVLPSIGKELGRHHTAYEAALDGLVKACLGMKNYRHAEPLLLALQSLREKRLGQDHPEYLQTVIALYQLYSASGQTVKALPLMKQVLVATLKKSDPDTFLVDFSSSMEMQSEESKAHIAAVLNEAGMQISSEAMRRLKTDKTGKTAEPIEDISRALVLVQKAIEWGCTEAVHNQARINSFIMEITATTIEKASLDQALVSEIETAKTVEAGGDYDKAIDRYQQVLEKTPDDKQLTVKLRLSSCLKTRAEKRFTTAFGKMNTRRTEHQLTINKDLDIFLKTRPRKKAASDDGLCTKCKLSAAFKITTTDKKDFLLCSHHYQEVESIVNRLPPSTSFVSEALYFAEKDLIRANRLIPDAPEICSLLDQIQKLKPNFPAYTPNHPGVFSDQNLPNADPTPAVCQRLNGTTKSQTLEMVLRPIEDNLIEVACNGRSSHTFNRSILVGALPTVSEDLLNWGEKLYEELFPTGTLAETEIISGLTRILLVIPDEFQDIPWEYICSPYGFLALNYHFVRGLPVENRFEPPVLDTPLWIVAVPAQPLDAGLDPLNIDGEWSILMESVQALSSGVRLEKTVPPTLDRLREIIANKKNRVVHFMGHGKIMDDDTVLCFENVFGGMDPVRIDHFVQRMKDTVYLVTLNACFTAKKLMEKGIPYALGMRTKVSDADSLIIARILYSELARGSTVEEAIRQVRQKLAVGPRKEVFGIPVLYSSLADIGSGYPDVSGSPRIIENHLTGEISVLPRSDGEFRGRFQELMQIGKCLTGNRRPQLLTIHGMGGQGKTTLARKAVERFGHAFPGGVWAFSLEVLPSREHFIRRLSYFLNLEDADTADIDILIRLLLTRIQYQRTLIVLDNAETLVDAVEARDLEALALSQFIRQSLISTNVNLLVTSRSQLGWSGEAIIELNGLEPTAGALLFFQCIPFAIGKEDRLSDRIFALGDLAEEISRKIEGHPLGLFLLGKTYANSGWPVRRQELESFIAQTDVFLMNASDKFQADSHRHRTLNSCIDISINSLTEHQRTLFSVLRLFKAYFLPELVAAVIAGQEASQSYEFMGIIMDISEPRDPEEYPDSEFTPIHNKSNCDGYFGGDPSLYKDLDALWRHGLLMREIITITKEQDAWQVILYRVLPAVHTYLTYRFGLNETENDSFPARFGEAYAAFSRILAAELKSSPIMRIILDKCLVDIERGVAHATGKAHADYLMALSTFWKCYGKIDASLETARQAVQELDGLTEDNLSDRDIQRMPQDQLEAGIAVAFNMSEAGDEKGAQDKFNEILTACRMMNDKLFEAQTLLLIGQRHRRSGNSSEALSYLKKSMDLYKQEKNSFGEVAALNDLGLIYLTNLGKLKDALRYFEKAHKISKEDPQDVFQRNDLGLHASILNNIGETNRRLGNLQKAMTYYEEALTIMHNLRDESEAVTLYNLGSVAKELGNIPKAKQYFHKALICSQESCNTAVEAAVYIEQAFHEPLDQGENLLKRACEIYNASGESAFEASALGSLAQQQQRMGKTKEAVTSIQQAVRLLEAHNLERDAGGTKLSMYKNFLAQLDSIQNTISLTQ